MARRPVAGRFRLLSNVVDRLANEPALAVGFTVEIKFDQELGLSHTVTEPRRQDLRSLLMEVRKLDSPGEDVYLPELLDLAIARVGDTDLRDGLTLARQHYDRLQVHGDIRISDGIGEISPRLAFELWAYGEHLHDDQAKAERMARLGPEFGALVRSNAVSYMDDLVRIAAYVRNAWRRDPGTWT